MVIHLLLKLANTFIIESHFARIFYQLGVIFVSIFILVHLLLELHHVFCIILIKVVLAFVLLDLVL